MADNERLEFDIDIEAHEEGIENLNRALNECTKTTSELTNETTRLNRADDAQVDSNRALVSSMREVDKASESMANQASETARAIEQARERENRANNSTLQSSQSILTTQRGINQQTSQGLSISSLFSKSGASALLGVAAAGKVALDVFEKTVDVVADITYKVVEMGLEFERTSQQVRTLADESVVTFDSLQESLLKVSSTYGSSISAINHAAYEALSASVKTEDLIELLDVAQRSSIAGFTDAETAIDGLTSVINAYGFSVDKSADLANKFLITQNLGKTTFGELASSIGQIAPNAKIAGLSIEDVLAAITTLTAQGISTEEAITQINGAINSIIAPSEQAKKAAAALGIEFNNEALKSKGLIDFLKEVYVAADGDNEALSDLFGNIRGFKALAGLVEGEDAFNEALYQMANNTTALDEAFAKMTDTVAYEKDRLDSLLESFGARIYMGMTEPAKEGLSEVNAFLDELIDAFEEDGVQGLIDKFNTISDDFYDAAGEAMGQIVKGFVSNSGEMLGVITELGVSLAVEFLESFIPALVEEIPDIALTLLDAVANVLTRTLGELFAGLLVGLSDIALSEGEHSGGSFGGGFRDGARESLEEAAPKLLEWLLISMNPIAFGYKVGKKIGEGIIAATTDSLMELDPLNLYDEGYYEELQSVADANLKAAQDALQAKKDAEAEALKDSEENAEAIKEEIDGVSAYIQNSAEKSYLTVEEYLDEIKDKQSEELSAFEEMLDDELSAREDELQASLDAMEEYYDKQLDAEKDRHELVLSNLKKEKEQKEGKIDEEEYNRDLQKMYKELEELQGKAALYGNGENLLSASDRKDYANLQEKIAAQTEKINEKIHEHDVQLRKKSLQEEYDAKVELENKKNEKNKEVISNSKTSAINAQKEINAIEIAGIKESNEARKAAFKEAQSVMLEDVKTFSADSLEILTTNWTTYIDSMTGSFKGALADLNAEQQNLFLSSSTEFQTAFTKIRDELKNSSDNLGNYMDNVDLIKEVQAVSPERAAAKANVLDLSVSEVMSLRDIDIKTLTDGMTYNVSYGSYNDNSVGSNSNNTTTNNYYNYYNGESTLQVTNAGKVR